MAIIYVFRKKPAIFIPPEPKTDRQGRRAGAAICNTHFMKPILRKVDTGIEHSFSVREDIYPYLYNHWHYHPELELTFIRKSCGTRLVGDHMERFYDGDLILLGSNLPHMWRNDDIYFHKKAGLQIEAIAIHFKDTCWGNEFLSIPEMKKIKGLLQKARLGIKITGPTRVCLQQRMEDMLHAKGIFRVSTLLEMLDTIANSPDKKFLSSPGFIQEYNLERTEKINEIYNYTFNHFTQPISIMEIADAVHISPNSFCRYFKTRTSKTFIQFLTEIRIGYACKLILEDQMSISQICFASGFNNLSNFNRRFKEVTGKTPMQYFKEYAFQSEKPRVLGAES